MAGFFLGLHNENLLTVCDIVTDMTEKLAYGELAPGVFDSTKLAEFDMTQAIIKQANFNLDYFTNPKSRKEYGGAYWQVTLADTYLMNQDEVRLGTDLYMPDLGGLQEVSCRVAWDNVAALRKDLGDIAALDEVAVAIVEKEKAVRERTLHKMGSYIVQRRGYYHVLLATEQKGQHRTLGSFADLRGVAYDPSVNQKPVPIVMGSDDQPATSTPVDGLYLYRG